MWSNLRLIETMRFYAAAPIFETGGERRICAAAATERV